MTNLLSPGTNSAGIFGPDAILSSTGSPVTDTPVTIYQSDGTTAATLYTSQTKAATATNPVNTDSYGNLTFFTDPGEYVLAFTVGGVATTKTIQVNPWFADGAWNVYDLTAAATLVAGDAVVVDASAAAVTITLPSPTLGARVRINKRDSTSNGVTVTTPTGAIQGLGPLANGQTSFDIGGQGQTVDLMANGTNWYLMGGSWPNSWTQSGVTATTINSYGLFVITFPVAFANACTSIVTQADWSSAIGQVSFLLDGTPSTTSAAGFVYLNGAQQGPGGGFSFNWIATGY